MSSTQTTFCPGRVEPGGAGELGERPPEQKEVQSSAGAHLTQSTSVARFRCHGVRASMLPWALVGAPLSTMLGCACHAQSFESGCDGVMTTRFCPGWDTSKPTSMPTPSVSEDGLKPLLQRSPDHF